LDSKSVQGAVSVRVDIAVVGAGPAGSAAALEAVRLGARVAWVDEGEVRAPALPTPNLTVMAHTIAWGEIERGRLELWQPDRGAQGLEYERVILCTGATDWALPFPGWTLPGVHCGEVPEAAAEVAVAGRGPWLWGWADRLAAGGRRVVAVIDASDEAMAASLPEPTRLGVDRLRGLGARLAFGQGVLEALRTPAGRLEVRIGTVGAHDALTVDTLVLCDGRTPASDLARQMGCAHEFDPVAGGWVPVLTSDLRTSRSEVFVAGDAAGLASPARCEAEGVLAARVAAADLGHGPGASEADRARVAELRSRDARSLEPFVVPNSCMRAAPDALILCPCEGVTAGDLRARIAPWLRDGPALAKTVRLGLGLCQGRICWPAASRMVADAVGIPLAQVMPRMARPPIRPVPVSVVAALVRSPAGH
jgi:thioredoxin reductase